MLLTVSWSEGGALFSAVSVTVVTWLCEGACGLYKQNIENLTMKMNQPSLTKIMVQQSVESYTCIL